MTTDVNTKPFLEKVKDGTYLGTFKNGTYSVNLLSDGTDGKAATESSWDDDYFKRDFVPQKPYADEGNIQFLLLLLY